MAKIYIIDVTNRDGVQTSRLGLAKLQKTLLNLYLNEMGVFQSEAGFPVTRHEINYLKEICVWLKRKRFLLSGFLAGYVPSAPMSRKRSRT